MGIAKQKDACVRMGGLAYKCEMVFHGDGDTKDSDEERL